MAKRCFKLDWNSLDYIAKALGFEGKMDNPKNLWIDCFNGDEDALSHMEKYNRQDIQANTHILEKLMPFTKGALSKEAICQNKLCGSNDIEWRGQSENVYQFVCRVCKKWGSVKIKTAD